MAAQMDYGFDTPKGVAGGKYDLSMDEVITRKNEEENGSLKFGMAVVIGSAPGTSVKLPTAASTKTQFEGIVLHAANTEHDTSGNVIVKNGVSLSVMRKGKVWGRISDGVTPVYKNPAYVVVDAEAGTVGTFTDTLTEGKSIDVGAVFGVATDNGIAVIEL